MYNYFLNIKYMLKDGISNFPIFLKVYDLLERMLEYLEVIFEESIEKKDLVALNSLPIKPFIPLNFDFID